MLSKEEIYFKISPLKKSEQKIYLDAATENVGNQFRNKFTLI